MLALAAIDLIHNATFAMERSLTARPPVNQQLLGYNVYRGVVGMDLNDLDIRTFAACHGSAE
jgi:hypothetical protein